MKNFIFCFLTILISFFCSGAHNLFSQKPVFKTKTLLLPFHDEPVKVTYEVIDGMAIMEEDILLGRDEDLRDAETGDQAVVIDGNKYRWPDGVVPYKINSEVKAAQRQNILNAMKHIEDKTSVKFVSRTNQKDYVEFVYHNKSDHVCWSQLGRRGGRQTIALHKDGCGFGTTVHEICHALGFWHEQSREDRDDFIDIIWENVNPDYKSQFSKHVKDGIDLGPYDYGSIMHYRATSFSKNGKPTIVPKKPGVTIGQRNGLSDRDINAINLLYPPISRKVTGIFKDRDKKTYLWVGADWDNFTKRWDNYKDSGLRLVDVEVHKEDGQWLFNGVWEKGNDKCALYRYDNWDSFTKKWAELKNTGYQLVDIETYAANNKRYFVGVWRAGAGGYGLYLIKGWEAFKQKYNALKADNLRLTDVEAYQSGNDKYFVGVWAGGTDKSGIYHCNSWTDFKDQGQGFEKQGLKLTEFETYMDKANKPMYVGVWREDKAKTAFWHNVSWSSLMSKQKEWGKAGMYLVDFEVN